MQYNIAAIPTTYNGVQFRSRLEARWGAFFDVMGWEWTYEPFDLPGWSPDFLLCAFGKEYLVEVKPITSFDHDTARKMLRAVGMGEVDYTPDPERVAFGKERVEECVRKMLARSVPFGVWNDGYSMNINVPDSPKTLSAPLEIRWLPGETDLEIKEGSGLSRGGSRGDRANIFFDTKVAYYREEPGAYWNEIFAPCDAGQSFRFIAPTGYVGEARDGERVMRWSNLVCVEQYRRWKERNLRNELRQRCEMAYEAEAYKHNLLLLGIPDHSRIGWTPKEWALNRETFPFSEARIHDEYGLDPHDEGARQIAWDWKQAGNRVRYVHGRRG